MLEVFATTYSERACRTACIAWARRRWLRSPSLSTISMACPNKHYIPMKLESFGLRSDNAVFIATDEPHGQIECTVGR